MFSKVLVFKFLDLHSVIIWVQSFWISRISCVTDTVSVKMRKKMEAREKQPSVLLTLAMENHTVDLFGKKID